jgi:hypothetical protein
VVLGAYPETSGYWIAWNGVDTGKDTIASVKMDRGRDVVVVLTHGLALPASTPVQTATPLPTAIFFLPTPTPPPGPASVPVPTAVPVPTVTPGSTAPGSCSPTTLLPEIIRNWGVLAAPLLQAQPPRPAVFGGTVTVDGSTVPDGTVVLACIDGTSAASASVSGGNWSMRIAEPPGQSYGGKTITFKIGEITARETAVWTANGGGTLNLTATSGS